MTEEDAELALFDEGDAWDGDPIRPATGPDDGYTPVSIVAALSRNDRALRARWLTEQAHAILAEAEARYAAGKTIVGRVILFSGGNDSTTLAHCFRKVATHTGHANTGIGIEATRQFVRDTSAAWGLPLIEKHGESYRDLVVDQGFPGPAMHWKMYQRLKERAIRKIRAELVTDGNRQRVIFIGGRRREESRRREEVPLWEIEDSMVWVSPFAHWTKLDLMTYRSIHNVPRNQTADLLHMSGECLCGAFAKPGELDLIAEWFPEVAEHIRDLEAMVRAAGHPEEICTWGHGKGRKADRKTGRLCSACDARNPLLFDFDGATQ